MPIPLARHISGLYSLSNTLLTHDVVRKRCHGLGWRIDEEDSDNMVLRVHLDNSVSVFVASLAPDQEFGRTVYLPLFYTEDTYDCVTGSAPDAKPDFDRAYALARSLFEGEIGAPSHVGTFEFAKRTNQFAAWRGSHAVLALIQGDFDVLFGSEITAWLIECAVDDPFPQLPPHH